MRHTGGSAFGELDQVEFQFVGEFERIADRQNLRLADVVADHTHFRSRDLVVDPVGVLLDGRTAPEAVVGIGCRFRSVIPGGKRPRREWFRCCDSRTY